MGDKPKKHWKNGITYRRGTSEQFAVSSYRPFLGEIVVNTQTWEMCMGDGCSRCHELPVFGIMPEYARERHRV